MPAPETAFAQQGQLKFFTSGSSAPSGFTFSGFPRIVIPKATVTLTWFEVPFDYILSANSTLVEFVGRINQLDWFGWDAGTLLYVGSKVLRRYTPPFPDRTTSAGGGATFSTSKLMDIALTFEETVRETPSAPTHGAGNTNTTVANRSYVIAGHNLQPWFGSANTAKGFYYAGQVGDVKTPVFDSAPMQLLFTDPDV